MKIRVTWFNKLDRKIWGKNAEKLSPYLGGVSFFLVIIMGIIAGGGNIFNQWFNWNTTIFMQIMIMLSLILWAINVIEAFVSMPSKVAATFRSLILLATFAFAYYLGYLGTIYILILIVVYVLVLIIAALVSQGLKRKEKRVNEPTATTGSSIAFTLQKDGRYLGSDHRYYVKDGDGYVLQNEEEKPQ